MKRPFNLTRRNFMASAAAGTAAMSIMGPAWGQSFPSRNLQITIPTSEGGGADRDTRIFCNVWRKYLDTNFELAFYPGAAGQVGYEFYMQRTERDPYNLLSSNMGPEVMMMVLQDTGINVGEDITFFQTFFSEPMAVFVGAELPIESLEQLVEQSQSRTVSCSVSRLPHPASIGMLAMAEETGGDFNLVPYAGGNPSSMAAITGEVDCCALPVSLPITLGEQVRILGVFANTNAAPEATGDAPTVNDAIGTDIPELTSSRAWAFHTETIENFPEEFALIQETMRQTLEDPELVEGFANAGVPDVFMNSDDQETTMATAAATAELAERYRTLLSEG